MKSASRSLCLALSAAALIAPSWCRADAVSDQDAARLQVVVDYANNVLHDAADHTPNRTEYSPLLAGGINVYTKEQLKWVFPSGRVLTWSDFTIQQNLMRELAALTNLTGDPKYKAIAKENYAYYFEFLQDKSGLLQWGGHRFVDLDTLKGVGMRDGEPTSPHELKDVYPYYEMMYEVNPPATIRYITAFWNAHVFNWHTLEVSRHGEYGHEPGAHWDNTFDDPAPYFETKGLSFIDAGNDLIYSGAMLYKLTGDQGALLWTKRLAAQYVKARDPHTKLGAYQYTQPRKTDDQKDDSITMSWFGDRAKRQYGPDFPGHLVLEATMLLRQQAVNLYSDNALMELQVAGDLGDAGKDMVEATREGMDAFVNYALIPDQGLLRPMLTDGTDLSGFVTKRNGYYASKGLVLEPFKASPEFMLSYARGFLVTGDPTLWKMARSSARLAGLGDIGATPGHDAQVNLATDCANSYALFSVLDLYRQTHADPYLQLARAIGNNIVKQYYHHGYFTPHEDTIFANINAIEPYALLALDAAIKGTPEKVPYFINGFGFYSGFYRFPDYTSRQIDDTLLFEPRKSAPELPGPRHNANAEDAGGG
jgi:pectate lyase